LSLGWACSILNAGVYPAQALLFAYLVAALLVSNIATLQSRADFLSIWWIVLAVVEFLALFVLNASFGYASEKMVRPHPMNRWLILGPTYTASISSKYH